MIALGMRAVIGLFFALLGAVVGLGACESLKAPPQMVATAPEWRVGDRWRHAWTVGAQTGVKTSEVVSVREMGGVRFYVVRVERLSRYYTLDLHWAANVVESRVAARAQPPEPWFMWPLEVGKRWEYQGAFEDRERKEQLRESYSVLSVERIEVPAGTFWAFKLVRQGADGSSDQYWYAPDARWYIKWLGRRGTEEFQETLQDYVAGTGGTPSAPTPDRPPGGKD